MKNFKILVVDDEIDMRESLRELLSREGYFVDDAENGVIALEKHTEESYDLIISDIIMPDMDGIALMKKIKETDSKAVMILITGYSSIQGAIEAIKLGAEDYFTKPFNAAEIKKTIERIYRNKSLITENAMLKQELLRKEFPRIIGKSAAINEVLSDIKIVAESDVSILVTGESGVGKELVAQAIHNSSFRKNEPFIPVNCAAVPKDLLESEFFGHEKGAFSGAINRKFGIFEIASKGTLFLDEIGEMPLELQAKLLRTVETKLIRRIGGNEFINVDIRIICSTNRNLKHEISEKNFREDLYFRLATFTIDIPPLRDRENDIPLLVKNFLRKRSVQRIAVEEGFMDLLRSYSWPGNVRELENVLERVLLLSKGKKISKKSLPREFFTSKVKQQAAVHTNESSEVKSLDQLEKEHILRTYGLFNQNKVKTANVLGIGLKTLYRKLEKYQKEN